jgi:2-phospho-L-lactate transferase/gluconeogenesis factor (CofD/UPF0052 family)
MKKLTETIKAKANQSARTFTITKIYSDGFKTKYRTIPMSQEEFDSEEMNTQNDWKHFLKSNNNYYTV